MSQASLDLFALDSLETAPLSGVVLVEAFVAFLVELVLDSLAEVPGFPDFLVVFLDSSATVILEDLPDLIAEVVPEPLGAGRMEDLTVVLAVEDPP